MTVVLVADTAAVCRAVMDDLPLTPVKLDLGRHLDPSNAAAGSLGWHTLLMPAEAWITVQPMGAYRPDLRGPEPLGDPVVVWWGPDLYGRVRAATMLAALKVAVELEQTRADR